MGLGGLGAGVVSKGLGGLGYYGARRYGGRGQYGARRFGLVNMGLGG